ncbi:hypothetical protein QHL1GM_18815 [Halomonas sp. QHL1]|nr:hypothetical protein QHL1GM_18815 [Halomonas sp. QHL1]
MYFILYFIWYKIQYMIWNNTIDRHKKTAVAGFLHVRWLPASKFRYMLRILFCWLLFRLLVSPP